MNTSPRAREAIALASDLMGGTVVSPAITTKTHGVGTTVYLNPDGSGPIVFLFADKFDKASEGGRASGFLGGAGIPLTGGRVSFNKSNGSPTRDNSIYIHEMAHLLGSFLDTPRISILYRARRLWDRIRSL